jgi:hypothetical protein
MTKVKNFNIPTTQKHMETGVKIGGFNFSPSSEIPSTKVTVMDASSQKEPFKAYDPNSAAVYIDGNYSTFSPLRNQENHAKNNIPQPQP